MARSISEIYNALATEKDTMTALKALQPNADNAQDLLSDITSPSKVADWRLWLWVVAFAHHIIEVGRDTFRIEIDAKVAATKAHTLRWYRLQALAFQYGHTLMFDEDLQKFAYALDVPAARIITNAATEESSGRVIIKVAKASGKLLQVELDAFSDYIGEVKDAGTDILFISTDADEVKATIDVYYDPQLMKPDGSLILDSNRKPVEEQMQAYLDAVGFNGAFILTDFVDYLQLAEGVDNPVVTEVQIKSNINPYAPVAVKYLPYAGYYALDLANTQITYYPNV